MSEYKRPCNCNWKAACGPNLLCPVHGNTHHMAAKIAELEAQTAWVPVSNDIQRHAEIRFGLALLRTVEIEKIPEVLAEYIRLRDSDYLPPTQPNTSEVTA